MSVSQNNEKIEKYLDELANEYKTLLYKALVSRSKTLDDLSVSELLRLDNEIKRPLLEDYQKQQRRRRLLLIAGLTYMFIGFFSLVTYRIIMNDFLYNKESMISLMSIVISIVGLFLTIYSFASQSLSLFPKNHVNRQEEQPVFLEYEVVTKWRELEGIVNDISLDANVKTPRSIIDFLAENRFIDENEHGTLKDFLKMRNIIVHQSNNNYSPNEIKIMICKIDKILDKIKKIV